MLKIYQLLIVPLLMTSVLCLSNPATAETGRIAIADKSEYKLKLSRASNRIPPRVILYFVGALSAGAMYYMFGLKDDCQ